MSLDQRGDTDLGLAQLAPLRILMTQESTSEDDDHLSLTMAAGDVITVEAGHPAKSGAGTETTDVEKTAKTPTHPLTLNQCQTEAGRSSS